MKTTSRLVKSTPGIRRRSARLLYKEAVIDSNVCVTPDEVVTDLTSLTYGDGNYNHLMSSYNVRQYLVFHV
jgi:hypothetical protein